jgi:pyrroloquinoline quinone (PQQ) biosynthesis protein C
MSLEGIPQKLLDHIASKPENGMALDAIENMLRAITSQSMSTGNFDYHEMTINGDMTVRQLLNYVQDLMLYKAAFESMASQFICPKTSAEQMRNDALHGYRG